MTAREHGNIGRAFALRADTIVTLMERCDAFRKPQRFVDMLKASECAHRGRAVPTGNEFPQARYLETALEAARAVQTGAIAKATQKLHPAQPERIAEAIHVARVKAVSEKIVRQDDVDCP